MGNINDYLKSVKDINLNGNNFNEVDSVTFCLFSLIDVKEAIPLLESGKSVTFASSIKKHTKIHKTTRLGFLLKSHLLLYLIECSKTKRFKNIKVHDLFHLISLEEETQSTFYTADLDEDTILIAFGATDDTIIGWKEDFNMMFLKEIPCDKYGLDYTKKIASLYPNKKIYLVGHSKGGHIATYVAFNAPKEIQKRIVKMICLDGPGFRSIVTDKKYDTSLKEKCLSILSDKSIVGRAFFPLVKPTIVKSSVGGLDAHDPTKWVVEGDHFLRVNTSFSKRSTYIARNANEAVLSLSAKESKHFVDALFSLLFVPNTFTLTEVSKKFFEVIIKVRYLDKKERVMVINVLKEVFKNKLIQKVIFPYLDYDKNEKKNNR